MIRCWINRTQARLNWRGRQYSGTEHRVIRGIGLISCVYVQAETGQFRVIDYRLYAPDGDGNSKLDMCSRCYRRIKQVT